MKKAYILFFTLVLLSCVSLLMGSLHLMNRNQMLWLDRFVEEQRELLSQYSLKESGITLEAPLQLKDGFGKIHGVK